MEGLLAATSLVLLWLIILAIDRRAGEQVVAALKSGVALRDLCLKLSRNNGLRLYYGESQKTGLVKPLLKPEVKDPCPD